MARKLNVGAYCGQCAKIAAQLFCESRDELKMECVNTIKACTVDDSHDVGKIDFRLGDTRADGEQESGACEKFELDMSSLTFGMCKCGFARAAHKNLSSNPTTPVLHPSKKAVLTPVVAEAPPALGTDEPQAPPALGTDESPALEPSVPELPKSESIEEEPAVSVEEEVVEETAFRQAIAQGHVPIARDILQVVRAERGAPYNWVVFKARNDELQVLDAGSGSVTEMAATLRRAGADQILYGLCRVALGLGKMRRAFWFFLTWAGERCTGVKAMQLQRDTERPMMEMIGDKSFTINATSPKDLTPDIVVAKVLAFCTVDVGAGGKYTVDDLAAAFAEEQLEIAAYYAELDRKRREEEAALKLAAQQVEAARLAEEQRQLEKAAAEAAAAAAEAAAKAEAERIEGRKNFAEAGKPPPTDTSDPMYLSRRIWQISQTNEEAWLLFEIQV
eukprot:NODE_5942_length_1719_cov_6.951005.p1 GENE.NODE_5942_length_1719_cov_6.951005~~NODE_5942_length_1719_cov_6.951005.p1  ORF type:complete len:447 (+),score=110.33 NODE_5942_length_1719_cov_6.951005:136-1476(+)